MKKILHLFLFAWIVTLTGCAGSSINVVDKKPPTLPYSKVLVVYVEDACDFALFDSLTYNICLKTCFLNADNFDMRSQVENILSKELTTATVIVRSTDLLDAYNNSYDYFRRSIDSLHIDALLLVDFRHYSRTHHAAPMPGYQPNNSPVTYGGKGSSVGYSTLNAGYECYLIKTSSLNFPVWTAELGTKGHIGAGKEQLNVKMAKTLAKSLKNAGYWMH